MSRKFLCSFSFLAFVVAVPASVEAQSQGVTEKQVYADYPSGRFTREHDGTNGVWQFAGVAKASRLGNTEVAYNPDLIDERGQRDIAATSYPLVGVQSHLDPDYLEYQVLSAKWARIDGFMLEWGYPGHSSNDALLALIPVAQKYGLKVGINWCIGWANFGPTSANDRESYLRRLDESADYILKTLYTAPNAARHGDRPVIMIFGGNLSEAEFRRLAAHRNAAAGDMPLFLRQGVMDGGLVDGRMAMKIQDTDWYSRTNGFVPEVGGFFGWVPARLRQTSGADAKWDREATVADTTDYLDLLLSLPSPARPFLRMSSAAPAFDNRPSAGWNKNDLSYLPRDNLAVYDAMWQFNIAHRARFDWVLIPTWNDWAESSEIEPTKEDHGAALALTERRIAELKGMTSQPTGLSLPLRLFTLRKSWQRIEAIQGASPAHDAALDSIARAISERSVDRAFALVAEAEKELVAARASIPKPRQFVLRSGARGGLVEVQRGPHSLDVAMPFMVARELRGRFYDGELMFEYRVDVQSDITIKSATDRKPSAVGDYSVVAQIRAKPAPDWQSARIRVYAENAAFGQRMPNGSDLRFTFSLPTQVRNVTLTFAVYPRTETGRQR